MLVSRARVEASRNISLRTQLGQAPWFEGIVGDSQALRRTLEAVEQVAATDTTVLISGETGTGKIESALMASRGRVAGSNGAAKRLGIAPSTLDFRIKRLGIDKFRYRATS